MGLDHTAYHGALTLNRTSNINEFLFQYGSAKLNIKSISRNQSNIQQLLLYCLTVLGLPA